MKKPNYKFGLTGKYAVNNNLIIHNITHAEPVEVRGEGVTLSLRSISSWHNAAKCYEKVLKEIVLWELFS